MTPEQRTKVVRALLTGVLGLASLAAFGLSLVALLLYYLALPPSPTGKTTGFVAGVQTRQVGTGKTRSTSYACDVSFKVDEKLFWIHGTNCGASWEGTDVTVIYQLSNPDNAIVDRGRGFAVVLGAIGFVLGGYPFYVLVGLWRGRRTVAIGAV